MAAVKQALSDRGADLSVNGSFDSATKSALMGLARASALYLGPFGVTVNCLAPGPFMTDMPMSVLSDAEKQAFADRTALGDIDVLVDGFASTVEELSTAVGVDGGIA